MSCKEPAFTIDRRAYDAVLFDLDGVVTKTAKVHAASWKKLFDSYLLERSARLNEPFQPFDIEADYQKYVDGKPRYEGVKSFLESRGITIPYGKPDDSPGRETVCGLGNRKNEIFQKHLESSGVETYEHAVEFLRRLKEEGVKTAVVSSSKNCEAVLRAAALSGMFDAKVDGVTSARLGLKGKPDPDTFMEAADRLGVSPNRAIVIEDAVSGVEAGKRGGFGLVLGVDRVGHARALEESGADLVVSDLARIAVNGKLVAPDRPLESLPSALAMLEEIERSAQNRHFALFLDYDGTLTPIVERPGLAVLSDEMRKTVRRLAERCTVAVISGRDLHDVQHLVGIDNIFYAGSHGFDISGPGERRIESQRGRDFLPVLERAERELHERLGSIPGALIERKKFSIAVHYRQVAKERVQSVEDAVDLVLGRHEGLRKGRGKKVFELQPDIDWNKGKALLWLLEALELEETLPIYIGDDVTDEDAFRVLAECGIGIVVKDGETGKAGRLTAARYSLEDPGQVREFLDRLSSIAKGGPR